MCGRFEVLTYEEVAAVVEAVEGRAELGNLSFDARRAQARPGSSILLFGHGTDDSLEIAESTWGFETSWSAKPVFNTRIESMLGGSALWRHATEQGRCIIPVTSFFEPHMSETIPSPRTGRPIKRQYQFASPDGRPLLLAGVQEEGRCSIVTCMPNSWVSPIHNRMPLALHFEEVSRWLSPGWPSLADRSKFELAVNPEQLAPTPQSEQLTLF